MASQGFAEAYLALLHIGARGPVPDRPRVYLPRRAAALMIVFIIAMVAHAINERLARRLEYLL